MPPRTKTPTRTIRVSEVLWTAAKQQAAHEDRTLTAAIVEFLQLYVQHDLSS